MSCQCHSDIPYFDLESFFQNPGRTVDCYIAASRLCDDDKLESGCDFSRNLHTLILRLNLCRMGRRGFSGRRWFKCGSWGGPDEGAHSLHMGHPGTELWTLFRLCSRLTDASVHFKNYPGVESHEPYFWGGCWVQAILIAVWILFCLKVRLCPYVNFHPLILLVIWLSLVLRAAVGPRLLSSWAYVPPPVFISYRSL